MKEWSGSKDEFLEYSLVEIANLLEARFRNALRPLGFTPHQFSSLALIGAHPNSNPAELARLVFITPQSMGAVLGQLENRGYIRRTGVRKRGVLNKLSLTAAGRKALGSCWTIVTRLDDETRAELGQDYQVALPIVRRLSAHLRRG